jgi:two-component system NarL family sensor kinase
MSYVAVLIATSVPVALGLLVVRRSGQRRIGWLLVAQGVSVGLLLGGAQAAGSGTAALIVDQLAAGSWIFLFLWLVLIAYLLPDGRTLSHGWLWWIRAGLAGSLLFLVGAAGDRSTFVLEHDGADPPLRWLPQSLSGVLGTVGLVLVVLLFLGSFVAVRSRLRRSAGRERLQLLWLVWGALAVPIGLLVLWVNYFALGAADWLTTVVLTLVSVALPATIAVAILRYNLFDVRLVLTRTLTYGALVVGVVAAYALVLYAAERMGGNGNAGGLAAVAIVAVAVHPAYAWLRERIERWVYGYRSQPYQALRLLADRADAADPDALSTAITDAVTEALRVHRVWVDAGGPDHEGVVRTALIHRGERLGYLAVEVPSGRTLSAADLSLLQDLARYAAVLVRAQWQADELRESRTRIVAGREEERRRLRRDLHDGVGPTLAAVVLTLNAAEAREDAGQRGVLLAEAREQVRDAISEVRRLVDDLRPPAIDEVGLLAAIRQRAAALSGGVTIEVSGPDPMPDLPAAVEVAAFRIASEAMANVARHSRASRCQVNMGVNGSFEMTIADNGRGADPGHGTRWGVGWTSMRERAAELGGRCSITERAQGGLVVRVVVPLEHPQAQDSDMEGDA